MNVDWEIINLHEQKFGYSCIPSAIEMVLKLLEKVSKDYYDLQDKWYWKYRDESTGSFADYDGYTIEGVIFEHKFPHSMRGEYFPYTQFFSTIDNELASYRYVMVSFYDYISAYFHTYVIYDNKNNDYQAFSKAFKDTVHFSHSVKGRIQQMLGTDILVYREYL